MFVLRDVCKITAVFPHFPSLLNDLTAPKMHRRSIMRSGTNALTAPESHVTNHMFLLLEGHADRSAPPQVLRITVQKSLCVSHVELFLWMKRNFFLVYFDLAMEIPADQLPCRALVVQVHPTLLPARVVPHGVVDESAPDIGVFQHPAIVWRPPVLPFHEFLQVKNSMASVCPFDVGHKFFGGAGIRHEVLGGAGSEFLYDIKVFWKKGVLMEYRDTASI